MADLDLTGIKTATAGEWITRGDAADLGVPMVRVSDLAEIVRRAQQQSDLAQATQALLDAHEDRSRDFVGWCQILSMRVDELREALAAATNPPAADEWTASAAKDSA